VTGVARKPRHLLSFVEDKIVKNPLYVGFKFMEIRTYARFVKIEKNDMEYYELHSVGIP